MKRSLESVGGGGFESLLNQLKMFDYAVRDEKKPLRTDAFNVLSARLGNITHTEFMRRAAWDMDARLTLEQVVLAMALKPVVSVFEIKREAAKLINNTQVNYVPHQAPQMLRRSGIIQAARIDRGGTLTGIVVSIGWFLEDGAYGIFAQTGPTASDPFGTLQFMLWRPTWTGEALVSDADIESDPLLSELERDGFKICAEALRFLIVLSILMGAEQTPLREDIEKAKRGAPKNGVTPTGWVTRHVYLSERPTARTYISPAEFEQAKREGLELEEVEVRGFIRRQRHGPGNSLVKEIYVRGFLSHRWVSPDQKRRIIVH